MGINVLLTGASGLVGRNIVKVLSDSEIYSVTAVGTSKEKLEAMYADYRDVTCISNDDLLSGKFCIDDVDYVIHCAFTRKNDPVEVTRALDFTADLYKLFKDKRVKGILGISTRSVYKEPEEGELNTEESVIAPNGLIGIAKYAAELMLETLCSYSGQPYSILRLGSVNELKTTDTMVRPMNVFVDCMLSGKPIHIVGGSQVMSYIAPQDIADAIKSILDLPTEKWSDVYNIGTGWMCTDTLLNIAKKVRDIGVKEFGVAPVEIEIEEKEVNMHAGQDITRLTSATGWKPVWTMEKMISDLYKMKMA